MTLNPSATKIIWSKSVKKKNWQSPYRLTSLSKFASDLWYKAWTASNKPQDVLELAENLQFRKKWIADSRMQPCIMTVIQDLWYKTWTASNKPQEVLEPAENPKTFFDLYLHTRPLNQPRIQTSDGIWMIILPRNPVCCGRRLEDLRTFC